MFGQFHRHGLFECRQEPLSNQFDVVLGPTVSVILDTTNEDEWCPFCGWPGEQRGSGSEFVGKQIHPTEFRVPKEVGRAEATVDGFDTGTSDRIPHSWRR